MPLNTISCIFFLNCHDEGMMIKFTQNMFPIVSPACCIVSKCLGGMAFSLLMALSKPVFAQQAVVTPNPLQQVTSTQTWRQEGEPRIRLVSPRNSAATAPVILPGMRQVARAQINDLQHEQGGPSFPARLLELRYGWEGLESQPREHEAGQVVWVTARVPAGAPPGRYGGFLNIQGVPPVPIVLEVGGWQAPRPNDFDTWQSLLNSPASVARQYGVEKWSDAHFDHMARSLRVMGEIGNHVLYLPPVSRSHFGNDLSMIRWTGGNNPQPELSALERYLALWDEQIGPPRKVIVVMSDAGWWRNRGGEIHVTTVNRPGEAGGTMTSWPHFSQPGQAERWRAAIGGVLQQIRTRGWDDTEVLMGVVGDERNFSAEMQEFFATAAPGLRWATFTHGRGDPNLPRDAGESHRLGSFDFAYVEFPYSPDTRRLSEDPLSRPPSPPRNSFPWITTFREMNAAAPAQSLEPDLFFLMPFGSRQDDRRAYTGFGRFGMDFWNLPGDGTLIGQFSRWHNLYRNNPRWMLFPAEEGPVASQHTEAMREGAALAEAMLQLHEALHRDPDGPQVDDDMQTRVREAYLGVYRLYRQQFFGGNNNTKDQAGQLAREDWQTAVREVYDVAGALQGQSPVPVGQPPRAAPAADAPPVRDWTSDAGTSIRGAFLGLEGGLVVIRLEDGRQIEVPPQRLSAEDQQWILQQAR